MNHVLSSSWCFIDVDEFFFHNFVQLYFSTKLLAPTAAPVLFKNIIHQDFVFVLSLSPFPFLWCPLPRLPSPSNAWCYRLLPCPCPALIFPKLKRCSVPSVSLISLFAIFSGFVESSLRLVNRNPRSSIGHLLTSRAWPKRRRYLYFATHPVTHGDCPLLARPLWLATRRYLLAT